MSNRYHFFGGEVGEWQVTAVEAVKGAVLPRAHRLSIVNADLAVPPSGKLWTLQGLTSNVRYATKNEVALLKARQQGTGRPGATRAALIPIRKSARWWNLAQDERRAIFEETSHHTAIGLDYLPAIARRLHHSRDLGEPFDFLTWFEFAPEHAPAFDKLVARLRATTEWQYVEHEVDIRLARI